MKRFILTTLCLLLLAGAGAGIYLFRSIGKSGSGTIEQWIGSELLSIGNSYLNPHLSFTDLDYTYPGTVSLKNLKLTAEDPANPGKMIDILGCGDAVVTLGEVPSVGKPIVIEKIVLDKPLFSAVAVAPASNDFVGYSNLIRGGLSSTTQPVDSGIHHAKLSDVFKMRLVELKDGKIQYDPRLTGTEPMVLDQINTSLKIAPAETGWYTLSVAIARKPVFDLSLAGQIDLDNFSARDAAVRLIASLGEDKLDYLPPQIQKLIRQYDIKGSLNVLVTGDLPIMTPLKGAGGAEIKLTGANIKLGEYKIPIDDLSFKAGFEDGEINLTMLRVAALKGVATVSGSAKLNETIDAQLKVGVAGMLLQDLLATRTAGEPLKMAGKLNAELDASAPLMVVLAKAMPPATQPTSFSHFASNALPERWGSAKADLTDGRLVEIPMVQRLTAAIDAAAKLISVQPNKQKPPSEQAHVSLNLTGDHATITEFNYIGELIAARGKGTVALDKKLDLTVNGGPIEKVQALLGKQVGGAIGAVTDQLVAYHVGGMVGDPKVDVQLGGSAVGEITNKTKSTVGTGVRAVGDGVNKIGEGIGNLLKR